MHPVDEGLLRSVDHPGAGVIDAAKQSFVDGMHLATAIGAGLMLLMAVLAARSRRR